MFFLLDAQPSLTCGLLRLDRKYAASALEIRRAKPLEDSPPEPWPFSITPPHGHPLALDDYYPAAKVMSRRMLEVLTTAGVSNLQRFNATLTQPANIVHETHQVVNVISSVKAKVVREGEAYLLSLSDWDPSVLIFRIASGLVVTEAIAKALRGAGLRNLALEPLPTTHIDAS